MLRLSPLPHTVRRAGAASATTDTQAATDTQATTPTTTQNGSPAQATGPERSHPTTWRTLVGDTPGKPVPGRNTDPTQHARLRASAEASPTARLDAAGRAFCALFGRPLLRPLSRAQRALDGQLRALVHQLPRALQKPPAGISAWGRYSALNLRGQRDGTWAAEKAVRFGHLLPVTTPPQLHDLGAVRAALKDAFAFPWAAADGRATDPRLAGVNFDDAVVVDVDRVPTKLPSDVPVVLRVPAGRDPGPALARLLDRQPFVVVAHEGHGAALHLIANHEYLDGVPAARALGALARALGGAPADPATIDDDALERLLQEADRRENSLSPERAYDVQSHVLPRALSDELRALHESAAQALAAHDIDLSLPTFLQLFLLRMNGVDGEHHRGGVLGFSFALDRQLGHYGVGDATAVLDAVVRADVRALETLGALSSSREGRRKVDLYVPARENIGVLVAPLANALPPALHGPANELAASLRVHQAASGGVMTSFLPGGMTTPDKQRIDLPGFGSPALCGFQDVAYTMTTVPADDGGVRIVVRAKARALAS